MNFILIENPDELSAIGALEVFPSPTADEIRRQAPDAHWVAVDTAGRGLARCSLWWRDAPRLAGERIGVIGHYAALDVESGTAILDHACRELATAGCTLAVGPMDGNTWRRYRFITERGDEPTFLMEPDNPDDWPLYWENRGFEPLATYSSALTESLTDEDPRMPAVAERLAGAGVTIRQIDPKRFEAELTSIFRLSLASFQHNFLYTPAPEQEFLAVYQKALPSVRPELVLMAEHEGDLVGFAFSVPDWNRKQRGEPVDTIIMKTLAVRPGRVYAGLGSLLVTLTQRKAVELGYTRAIHALMHDSNHSRNISDRLARTMRRYTLYARRLTP